MAKKPKGVDPKALTVKSAHHILSNAPEYTHAAIAAAQEFLDKGKHPRKRKHSVPVPSSTVGRIRHSQQRSQQKRKRKPRPR